MDPRDVFNVLQGVAGLILIGYGTRLLSTGRMPAFARGRWRRPLDAGMFLICGGLFFVLLMVVYQGTLHGLLGSRAGLPIMAVAFGLFVFGFVRYRPHRSSRSKMRKP